MKLLVAGAGGQVGHELRRLQWPAGYAVVALDRAGLDIAGHDAVFAAMARHSPDLVINAAAYTAVDKAESEPEAAQAGNCDGPANLAAACREAGVPLIHISTDYVFDGSKEGPYREDDPVKPLGAYGRTKEAGDRAVREALREHVIVRTAWVYSAHGHNFVKTMLRVGAERPVLRVVADQRGCPTSAADIAGALASIVERIAAGEESWGAYHFWAPAPPLGTGSPRRSSKLPNPGPASGRRWRRSPPPTTRPPRAVRPTRCSTAAASRRITGLCRGPGGRRWPRSSPSCSRVSRRARADQFHHSHASVRGRS